jgi:N-methylhydantoinase B
VVWAPILSGSGPTPQQDGWHACGPECCFGALTSGDVELLEYSYPIIIHRYSLIEDSGGAGKFRGGSGTAWEVEPLDRDMTFITFGEGRRIPAVGAAGAISKMVDAKVGRIEVKRDGKVETIRKNVIENLKPGETVTNLNPGGGGYGNPFERPVDKIVWDVKNGLVSVKGARDDYGVIITDGNTLSVDMTETNRLRGAALAAAHHAGARE